MQIRLRALLAAMVLVQATLLKAQLIGVEFDTGAFYAIDPTDGALQLIEDTDVNQIGALEWNPSDGFIYGFTAGENAALYRFDIPPSLDQVTAQLIGPLGPFMSEGGIAFSPGGTAYAFNGLATVPYLVSINLQSGAATPLVQFSERHDISGLGWRNDGMLIGLDSTENELIAIDPVTLAITLIDDVPTVGPLGGIAHGLFGSFLVTAGPDNEIPGSNSLFSFDPTSGDLTLIANYEEQVLGQGFSGLTFIPEPATLLLLMAGALLIPKKSRHQ